MSTPANPITAMVVPYARPANADGPTYTGRFVVRRAFARSPALGEHVYVGSTSLVGPLNMGVSAAADYIGISTPEYMARLKDLCFLFELEDMWAAELEQEAVNSAWLNNLYDAFADEYGGSRTLRVARIIHLPKDGWRPLVESYLSEVTNLGDTMQQDDQIGLVCILEEDPDAEVV